MYFGGFDLFSVVLFRCCPDKRNFADSWTCSTWLSPRPIWEPQKLNLIVVIFRRWNQTAMANTTLLFILPPRGPQGCVTITARLLEESAILELDPENVNFRSFTEDDGIVDPQASKHVLKQKKWIPYKSVWYLGIFWWPRWKNFETTLWMEKNACASITAN